MLQHIPVTSQREPINHVGAQACHIRMAREDTAVVLVGMEESDSVAFDGERKDITGRYKKDHDVSTIEWRLPKQGKVSGWESIAHILLLRSGEENEGMGGRFQ